MTKTSPNSDSLSISILQSYPKLWKLFTKEEEYTHPYKDKYNRFTYFMSQHRNVLEPVVSKFLIKKGLKTHFPEDKKFAVCLTHDIDIIYFTKRRLLYQASLAFRQKKIAKTAKILLNRVNKKFNPIWNFQKIISLEQKYGASSTFFFLALEKEEEDFNFRINDLKNDLKQIIYSGNEIGLHTGHTAASNIEYLVQQKKRIENAINKPIFGCRNHFLRFQTPNTWELLHQAGFKYDTSFGYSDCVGFRNGMCHPFKPFNLKTGQFIDILEIPLIIMDDTFESYMKFNFDNALKICKNLIDQVAQLNGVITILWHNTNMFDEHLRLYKELLSYCREKGAWMTSGEKIRDWWEKHRFLTYQ